MIVFAASHIELISFKVLLLQQGHSSMPFVKVVEVTILVCYLSRYAR
jgi:hypothetical protein